MPCNWPQPWFGAETGHAAVISSRVTQPFQTPQRRKALRQFDCSRELESGTMTIDDQKNSTAFVDFARVAEMAAGTTKRNEKAEMLGDFFRRLSDDDLQIAARVFAGHIFPLWDQRTTNVGFAALLAAITGVTGFDRDRLFSRLVPLGDLGDLADEALSDAARSGAAGSTLTPAAVD